MGDWLSILLVVLIIGIVLDGLRRARNAKKGEVRLSKNARKADKLFNTEVSASRNSDFPSGGARIKSSPAYSAEDEIAQSELTRNVDEDEHSSAIHELDGASDYEDDLDFSADTSNSSEEGEPSGAYSQTFKPSTKPEQASLNLDDPVPMLMDSVAKEESDVTENEEAETPEVTGKAEPQIGTLSDLDALDEVVEPSNDYIESHQLTDDFSSEPEPVKAKKSRFSVAAEYFHKDKFTEDKGIDQEAEVKRAEEILIINVMARSGGVFSGEHLLEVMTNVGLKFGDMGIFHRHLDNDGDADSVFSVANIVEPGTFDLSTIKSVESPGLCMFLSLPCAGVATEAYEDLVQTARALSSSLGGELKDENRSALTNQTIEHGRQRVIEFERKNKLHKQK